MSLTEDLPDMLTPEDVARHLRVSVNTLKAWRKLGRGPAYTKLGPAQNARVRYRREAVESFAEQYLTTPAGAV